jgi:hypothetical protein
MLLVGRISGWFMVLGGVFLLVRYFSQWAAAGRLMPVAMSDLWNSSDNLMLTFMEKSVADQFSAAMVSAWTAALLIIFGTLLVWGCRRGPKQR